jgi:N-acetylmuramoyl-L-alanine amidase
VGGRRGNQSLLYPPLKNNQGQPSAALAQTLGGALRADGFTAADYIGSARLYPRSDLAGLNLAQIPAALVECANMRNRQEAAMVSTPHGRARYAAAIADGIIAWLPSRGHLTTRKFLRPTADSTSKPGI